MRGGKDKGCGEGSSGSTGLSREERAKKRGEANPEDLGHRLLHMAHNGANVTDATGDTEEDGSEEEGGSGEAERLQREADVRAMREELEVDIERRLRSEFERAARLREEKERAARVREERERAAQDAVTPRRGGPPAPSSPASEQGKK